MGAELGFSRSCHVADRFGLPRRPAKRRFSHPRLSSNIEGANESVQASFIVTDSSQEVVFAELLKVEHFPKWAFGLKKARMLDALGGVPLGTPDAIVTRTAIEFTLSAAGITHRVISMITVVETPRRRERRLDPRRRRRRRPHDALDRLRGQTRVAERGCLVEDWLKVSIDPIDGGFIVVLVGVGQAI